MVKIMLASHGNLAAGMLSSAEMVFGKQDNVSVICAYVDGEDDVSTRIKGFIDSIAPDDSWIIFTDLFGGSVNNEFMKYISNPQIRLIAGMNLALVITAMSISEMKNNAAEVEEELLGIADSVINVRVDHRLLHGQVAMAWNQVLGSDCILIANDSVPNDEIRKAGIKLAKPANTKLVIKNMDASVEALVSGVTDKYKLFIVVESIADVYKLCKETGMIDKITLGGVKSREGTRQISKAVFTTPKEEELLKELITDGVTVEIRQVPSDSVIYAKDVL